MQDKINLDSFSQEFCLTVKMNIGEENLEIALVLDAPAEWGGTSQLIPKVRMHPGQTSFYMVKRLFRSMLSASQERLSKEEVSLKENDCIVRFAADEELLIISEPQGLLCELTIYLLSRRNECVCYAVPFDSKLLESFCLRVITVFDEVQKRHFPEEE